MSDLNFDPVMCRSREARIIMGSFKPNGSSALASSSPTVGDGFTVARTSKGLFTVTLADEFPAVAAFVAKLRMAGAHPYKVNVGAVDVSSAKTVQLYVESVEPMQFTKAAVDGAAGTTTAETIIGRACGAMPIGHTLYLSPQAALTADNTNYATITISKRTAGASKTTVATLTTQISGGGSWVAFTPIEIPLTAAVAAGDTLQIEIAKAASGVAVQPFVLQASGLQDLAAAATTLIEFAAFLKDTGVSP